MAAHHPKGVHEILLKQKEHMAQVLKAKFARYGDEVCTIITQEAVKPNGMLYLIQRLSLGTSRKFDNQIEILSRFLAEYGSGTFLAQYRKRQKNLSADEVNAMKSVMDGSLFSQDVQAQVEQPPAKFSAPTYAPDETQNHKYRGPVFDKNGKYTGPERRMQGERRSGKDRRKDVDCVLENRRFGGDRRQEVRRTEDKLKDPNELGMP